MGKITITKEFDPDQEREELGYFLNGSKYATSLWELDSEIRTTLKYSDDGWLKVPGAQRYLEALREIISDSGAMDD